MSEKAPQILFGLVHHEDPERTASQAREATLLIDFLETAGLDIKRQVAFHQAKLGGARRLTPPDYWKVVRTYWAQEIFNAAESRRRRGSSTRVPPRKKLRISRRLIALLAQPRAVARALSRREIEGALSLKHLHLWSCLANSAASGAIVVEDDFSLRDEASLSNVKSLIDRYGASVDYIDLAGGFSRSQLSLPEASGGDLVLNYLLSNTTCGYFISRRASIALVDLMNAKPDSRYLSPDFIIGSLNDSGFEGTTVLPKLLPLVHGSLEGVVESSIPY